MTRPGTKLAAALIALLATTQTLAVSRPRTTEQFDHEAASRWMETLYEVVRNEGTPPPAAARIYGLTAVTLYEIVVPGSDANRSLAGQLQGLATVPQPRPPRKLHWALAANAGMAAVVRGLYPAAKQTSLDRIDALESELDAAYSAKLPAIFHRRSVEHGEAIAAAILAWAATDGLATYNACAYTPPVGPGLWEPTPPAYAAPLQPCWGQLRTMALDSGEDCAPPPPPEYSVDPFSSMYAEALNVRDVGVNLTQEQKDIANYWADGPGATGTPGGHSISLATNFVLEDDLDLMAAAEAYARVGIAIHDAFISCWNVKYTHNLLRPISYIQDLIDPAWAPLLTTPNFPEYTSGHSSQSGATEQVLLDFLGSNRAFTDTTRSRHGLLPSLADRSLTVTGAAEEAALSRLYGGIHYAVGNNAGLAQGRCIGQTIVSRVQFEK